MPFQGNPNAGAPNVELLRFLADQKATRAKLALEQQKAEAEARRQAILDQREEQKFQVEMANALETQRQQRIKTAQDMQGLLGSIGSRAEAIPAGQRQEAQSQQFFGSVGDGDQQLGQDFAAAVLPNDPNAFNEELALASTLTGDRNLDRDVSQAAAIGGISRSDVLGGAQTELSVRDLAAKRELDKTKAAEQRQEGKESRLAIAAHERSKALQLDRDAKEYERSVSRPTEQITFRRQEVARLGAIVGNPEVPEELRVLAREQRKDLLDQIEHDNLSNIPDAAFKYRKEKTKDISAYNADYRVHAVRRAMLTRMEAGDTTATGVQAQLKWWTANIRSLVEDATKMPFVEYYAESVKSEIDKALAAGDTEYAETLRNEMLDEATLERIAAGQINDNDATWLALTTNNPSGRTSNLMYKEMRAVNETIGATISSALAMSKLKANVARTGRALLDRRNELNQKYAGELDFDPKTGAWIPASSYDAADDALVDDAMNAPVSNAVRRASPTRLSPETVESLLEYNRRKREAE